MNFVVKVSSSVEEVVTILYVLAGLSQPRMVVGGRSHSLYNWKASSLVETSWGRGAGV